MTDKRCPCGGTILADTNHWAVPLCDNRYCKTRQEKRDAQAKGLLDAYRAVLENDECQADEGCDHCVLLQPLSDWETGNG